MSAVSVHVVGPVRMRRSVERALVRTLPKNSWRCDAPGAPGNMIGSSRSEWENPQCVTKKPLGGFATAGSEPRMTREPATNACTVRMQIVPIWAVSRSGEGDPSRLRRGPDAGPSGRRAVPDFL
ncbi:MAG: hypothetical protein ACXWZU_02660 [Actinomycetota bacterium]